MTFLRRLLREPLLHFLLIGVLIFYVNALINDETGAPENAIVISSQRIAQLADEYSGIWKRQPTEKELDTIIKGDIREEVYYRDAVALGLDKSDAIVRRRLRQKMEFLIDAGAYALQPATGELEAYFADNVAKYQRQARFAFEQLYLGKSPDIATMKAWLASLRSDKINDLSTIGEPSRLPAEFRLSSQKEIDGTFGKGFFQQLTKFKTTNWGGPVISAFGTHFVRIVDRVPARTPSLDEVRKTVMSQWRLMKAKELREADYTKRRNRYAIEIRIDDWNAREGK